MNMCPSNKRKNQPELCLKGQVFFIWSSLQSLEIVKDRISLLGGKVDPFLSRDVTTVLVEDNHLVGSQLPSKNLTITPTYGANGTLVTSFPYTNTLCNLPSTSRGFNVVAASSSNSPYRVICYALQWGIQVLGIDQFLTWIEPQVKTAIHLKKKATENVSKLSGCFIKFESFYKNYRPCYKMFNNDPDRLLPLKNANVLVKADTCNVILDKPIASRQFHFSHMDTHVRTIHPVKNTNVAAKANDKKPPNNKLRPKEENNYCECCRTHFADLKNHIKSVKHQNFVSNEKNYESVHNIIKMLPTAQEFIEKLQNPSPNPGLVLTNGDSSICMAMANTPDTDFPMPVNLQVRKETAAEIPMPMDLHIEKGKIFSVPPTYVKRDEDMPLPLDLHVKRDTEAIIEAKDIKQEINLFADLEPIDSSKRSDLQAVPPKLQIKNVEMAGNVKFDEKTVEMAEDLHCDSLNGDPLFDKTNTAALAQLCLKNFDSYWLDSLPCEMDDMVFDDIFDIDDGKMKFDNDCSYLLGENFVTSDIAQTPGMVSGISTPNFKTPTNTNTSFYINTPIDVKDIKSEAINLPESFPSNCKLEKDLFSSQNIVTSFNEPLMENKNKIFSIAQFVANKVSVDATPSCSSKVDINAPSCSNAISNNNTELLFSSESSDDENENVLISNVLHMITNNNSDSDLKVGKESDEDNSAQGHCTGTTVASPGQKNSVETKIDLRGCEETSYRPENPATVTVKTQSSGKESFPNCEMIKDISYKKGSLQQEGLLKNFSGNQMKVDIYSYKKKSLQTQENSSKIWPASENKSSSHSCKKKSPQTQENSQNCLPVNEIKTDIYSHKKKSLQTQSYSQQNSPTNKVKKDVNNQKKSSLTIKKSNSDIKTDKRHAKNVVSLRRNSTEMKGNDPSTIDEDSVPSKKVCSYETNIVNQNTAPESNTTKIKSIAGSVEKNISINNYRVSPVPLQDRTFSERNKDLNTEEISSQAVSVFSAENFSRECSKEIPVSDKKISSNQIKVLKDFKESSIPSKSASSNITFSTDRPNEMSKVGMNEKSTKEISTIRRISSETTLSKEVSSVIKNTSPGLTEVLRQDSVELSNLQSHIASVDIKLNLEDFKRISVTEQNIISEVKLPSEILAPDKNIYSDEKELYKEDSKIVPCLNFSETKIASNISNKISNLEKNISCDMKFDVEDFKEKPAKVNSIYLGKTKIFEESEVSVKNDSPGEMKIFERSEKYLSSIKNSPSSEMKICRENEEKFLVPIKESPKTYEESNLKQVIAETASSYKTNIYGDSYEQSCIPVKKRSREISVNQGICGENYVKLKSPCDEKIEQSIYQKCPIKRQHSKDEKTHSETGKIEPIVVKKHCFSEMSVIKQTKKTFIIDSANPCQYLNTTEKVTADICPPSSVLPAEPVISDQTVKIPHKKPSPKLQKLPPLWSVSILPGSGVKLKFTCIHSKNTDTHQDTNRESPLSVATCRSKSKNTTAPEQ